MAWAGYWIRLTDDGRVTWTRCVVCGEPITDDPYAQVWACCCSLPALTLDALFTRQASALEQDRRQWEGEKRWTVFEQVMGRARAITPFAPRL